METVREYLELFHVGMIKVKKLLKLKNVILLTSWGGI